MSPGTGRIPTVVLTLMVDEAWDLVHLDDLAVVFVRSAANPGIPALRKETLERFLRLRAEAWLAADPGDARPHVVLGALAIARNDLETARVHFEEALRLDPTNPDAIRVLDRLR
jgi:cytochrome c-type biogenesis protein CcmH/NrfG